MKKISIVGAGPGGLTAGMILAHNGFDVTIYEKNLEVGGRNSFFEKDGFKFDIGPTFLMLKSVLIDLFDSVDENIQDYMNIVDLDIMYELFFKERSFKISSNHETTYNEIKKIFPGEEEGFREFLKKEKKRFDVAMPCLRKDYSSFYKLFNKDLFKFIAKLSYPNSMYDELGKYFKSEDLKMAFTFQSKYLGMSPWSCPAAFMIIPYIEHDGGISHVEGGLTNISLAMKEVFLKKGGKLKLGCEISDITENTLTLKGGDVVKSDKVIINADVGYALKELTKTKDLSNKDFSCSTYMLYLGIDKELDLSFHSIFFSDDYKSYVDSVFSGNQLNQDISIYVRNASILDKTIAPEGKSNLYVLVPVPNNKSGIDWDKEKYSFRDLVIDKIEKKSGISIRENIISETIITPYDWEKDYNVFLGATFNLAHTLNQMLYFRPHNKLSSKQYLVGGGTHPGSGLPTIYQSGVISANLILDEYKK